MCDYVAEPSTLWLERTRTARQAWTCSVCREPIPPGSAYTEVTSMFERRFDRDRAHTACVEFTRRWQLDVCTQRYWTITPTDTPHEAVLEHVIMGDIGAAEGASVWRDWMRARQAEGAVP